MKRKRTSTILPYLEYQARYYIFILPFYSRLRWLVSFLKTALRRLKLKRTIGRKTGTIEDYRELLEIYFNLSYYNEVINLCRLASEQFVSEIDKAEIELNKGLAFFWLGEKEDAAKSFHQSLEHLPETDITVLGYTLRGDNYYYLRYCINDKLTRENYVKKAISKYEKAITNFPVYENRFHYEYLGELYYEAGQYEKAIGVFRKLVEIKVNIKNTERAFIGIAESLKSLGKSEEAQNYYHSAIKESKDAETLLYVNFGLGLIYMEKEKWIEAGIYFMRALICLKTLPSIHRIDYKKEILRYLGQIIYELGYYQDSIKIFNRLIKEISQDDILYVNTLLYLAHNYFYEKEVDKAKIYCESVLVSKSASEEEREAAKKILTQITIQ